MNADEGVVREELGKWFDVLDLLKRQQYVAALQTERGLQLARECSHPDAQWLASLFPAGEAVSAARFHEVMHAQGDGDARAVFFASRACGKKYRVWSKLLRRAAEMGYAPAQAEQAGECGDADAFYWAELAAAQGNRSGLVLLGQYLSSGEGCEVDFKRALEAWREAALLGSAPARFAYGNGAVGKLEWKRYQWWESLAAQDGGYGHVFFTEVVDLLGYFKNGELGRIMHIAAPLFRTHLDRTNHTLFGREISGGDMKSVRLVLELHDAMLARARDALLRWGMVARRRRVAKDIRVLISKMAWQEVWRWGEKRKLPKPRAG
jgi:TPR repeat protein